MCFAISYVSLSRLGEKISDFGLTLGCSGQNALIFSSEGLV